MTPSSAERTRSLVLLALLTSAAILLRCGESLLPLPAALGGMRPGLANAVTVICLYLFTFRQTAMLLAVRILLTALLLAGFMTPGFFIGLSGAALSLLCMYAGYKSRWFSPYGVSVLGAAAHNMGQLAMAAFIMGTGAVAQLLPFLLLISIPFGLLTGFAAARLIPVLQAVRSGEIHL